MLWPVLSGTMTAGNEANYKAPRMSFFHMTIHFFVVILGHCFWPLFKHFSDSFWSAAFTKTLKNNGFFKVFGIQRSTKLNIFWLILDSILGPELAPQRCLNLFPAPLLVGQKSDAIFKGSLRSLGLSWGSQGHDHDQLLDCLGSLGVLLGCSWGSLGVS